MICCAFGSRGFRRNSFITILECSTHNFHASLETLSYTFFPISPFQGIRSSPGISRPNLTHFTIRTLAVAGCAVAPAPEFPELFSSAIKLSYRSVLHFKILQRYGKFQFQGGRDGRRTQRAASHCPIT